MLIIIGCFKSCTQAAQNMLEEQAQARAKAGPLLTKSALCTRTFVVNHDSTVGLFVHVIWNAHLIAHVLTYMC